MKQGVISLGEVFVDLISEDMTNTTYQTYLGGATVNVAVGVRRLGIPSYFLCKLGKDETSAFVLNELNKEQVNLDYAVFTSKKKVCSVYVHLNDVGDRYFYSYLNPTPHVCLTKAELKREVFNKAKIFYFGSGTLFHDTARVTTEQALRYAKEFHNIVAFDTNIRLKRWDNEEFCRETINTFLKKADIVKMAEDELLFLTETNSMEDGLIRISDWNIPYLFITLGKEGACAVHKGKTVLVPGHKVSMVVDTTGAGDAFFATILTRFHDEGPPVDHSQLKDYLQSANKIAALSTTKSGSL